MAVIRLGHPFPSILDGAVVAVVALVAGAEVALAIGLGVSMVALQISIGAVNDLHDAPWDAARKPGKPIPAGLVSVPVTQAVVFGGAAIGIGLGALVDPRLAALAIVVLLIGYGYDLVFKGTAWSWLPFAVGIPILPVYGWFGAAGSLPGFFAALIPMAVLAGAALAIANARVDLERDLATGIESVATRLGLEGSWRLQAVLLGASAVVGIGWVASHGAGLGEAAPFMVAAGFLALVVGRSRRAGPIGRERAWEFEAAGTAVALVVWLATALS